MYSNVESCGTCFQIANLGSVYHLVHDTIEHRSRRSAEDIISRLLKDPNVHVLIVQYIKLVYFTVSNLIMLLNNILKSVKGSDSKIAAHSTSWACACTAYGTVKTKNLKLICFISFRVSM